MSFSALLAANARGMLDLLQARIADLGDEEMSWAPVEDCLRMGEPAPQVSHFDGTPSPVATIGWRLEHIAAGLTEERIVQWLSAPVDVPAVPAHETAEQLRAWVASAADWFCGLVTSLGDEHLAQPLGPVAGMWGGGPRAGFVMHMTNEAIHHGAEVAVLRDLWRAGLR